MFIHKFQFETKPNQNRIEMDFLYEFVNEISNYLEFFFNEQSMRGDEYFSIHS